MASVPIIAAAARRAANGWQPASDNAAIARLAHDVFSRHSPLLGMPSTLGGNVVPRPHHWGPMLFWVLAIPDRLLASSPVGLLIAVALVNLASLAGIVVFANRQLGTGAAAWILGLLGLAFFSLGQEVISSVWNPDIALMPLALFLILVWSLACGDTIALPWAVASGSFVVQAHIVYTPVVVTLGAWGLAGLVATVVGRHRDGPSAETRASQGHLRRHLVAALAVAAVCWSTVLYQQMTGHPGNISVVLDSDTLSSSHGIGLSDALHLIAHALSFPPLWAVRHSRVGYYGLYDAPSLITGLVALFVFLAPVVFAIRHRGDRHLRALVITSVVMTVGSLFTVARLPGDFLVVNPYRVRFVWLAGAFAWFVLGVVAVRSIRVLRLEGMRVALATGVAFILVFGAIAASTSHTRHYADLITDESSGTIATLSRQLRGRLSRDQPYILHGVYLDNVGYGVMWDLVRHSYDIRLIRKDPYFGEAHAPPRGRAISTLVVIDHASARPTPTSQLLATSRPTAAVRRQLERREAALCSAFQRDPPRLTRTGRALLQAGPRALARLLLLHGGQMATMDGTLLATLAAGHPSCDALWNPLLEVLLRLHAIRTSALTGAQVSSFQNSRSLAASLAYDVYLETPG